MKQETHDRDVKIWAHRGANEYAPENTLEAFEAAVRAGADGVELDVHQTRDNRVVVIHDERLDRTSTGSGFVKDCTLEELRRFDYAKDTAFEGKARYTIPTLEDVFGLLEPTGLTVNIELKTNVFHYFGIERRILKLAEEYGMRDRIWYSSFNRLTIEKIHLLDRKAKVGFLYAEVFSGMPVLAGNLGLSALHPSFPSLLSPRFMKECRNNGIAVNVWTIDSPEQLRACYREGVNAVITNYPDRAGKIFAEMAGKAAGRIVRHGRTDV